MSSNLPYKQAANVERRTWDTETYEARAKARRKLESEDASGKSTTTARYTSAPDANKNNSMEHILNDGDDPEKEEFQSAPTGAQGPLHSKRAFLKARRSRVDIDSKVGKTEIINPDAAAKSCTAVTDEISITDGVTKTSSAAGGVGWHCKVCDCFLKDSLTYLDHINGRKHQRALGYTMRITKSTTNEVVGKLNSLAAAKQKRLEEEEEEQNLANIGDNVDVAEINEFDEMVRKKDDEEKQRKAERKRRREERKKKVQQEREKQENNNDEEEYDDDGGGGVNPDIAAMMGFSGFS